MLLLTSTNDRLQIVTSSAATIDVHASWVDTSVGTITPGRTNTAISAATVTSVAGAPAASTQRNVKTLHVRNKDASLNCDITVQHTDGTIISQLYKVTLGAGEMLEYTDQAGFGGGRIPASTGGSGTPTLIKFTASGTYTPTAGMSACMVECVGGGGGGGAATGGTTPATFSAGGGGSGGYSKSRLTAAQVGVSQTVTIGTAGAAAAVGANGGAGGDTSLGTLVIAKGGSGGALCNGTAGTGFGTGGAGGIAGTGDITANGSPGESGQYASSGPNVKAGGGGGSGFFGGGATPTAFIGGTSVNGNPAANYGSGGAGGITQNTGGTTTGGAGSAGIVVITEWF